MKRLRLKKISIVFCTLLMLINFSGCSTNNKTDLGTTIDSKLDTICSNPKVSTSSNPYDYTKNSQDYKDIVSLGNNALTYMLTKFEGSKENGLKEYIMAIACSEILKENVETKKWETGREWYDNYIKMNK